jgi:hypothetical protein
MWDLYFKNIFFKCNKAYVYINNINIDISLAGENSSLVTNLQLKTLP